MYNYITHKEKEKQRYHRFHIISIYTMEANLDEENPKNEFFFNEEGKVRMENSHQNQELWVDYNDIWTEIEADFENNYKYINKLIQSMVGEAHKIRSFPTNFIGNVLNHGWERYNRH